MESLYDITYTTRDRILRAWEEAMDLVRKFETWSKEIGEEKIACVFAKFAEDEALIAAKFFELLQEYDK